MNCPDSRKHTQRHTRGMDSTLHMAKIFKKKKMSLHESTEYGLRLQSNSSIYIQYILFPDTVQSRPCIMFP